MKYKVLWKYRVKTEAWNLGQFPNVTQPTESKSRDKRDKHLELHFTIDIEGMLPKKRKKVGLEYKLKSLSNELSTASWQIIFIYWLKKVLKDKYLAILAPS